jgi:hypothetical protein
MVQTFRLYWLRENGRDAGTPLRADQLDPRIQRRVVELAAAEPGEIAVRLPFFDFRDWRRREKLLTNMPLARRFNTIEAVLPLPSFVRDRAATLALTHPAWTSVPRERDPLYFRTWQNVSVALQSWLRKSIADEYFKDLRRYEDRDNAFPMLVYQVARVCYGRPNTEFTYDLSDYPECPDTLASTWKMTGNAMQRLLGRIEEKLSLAGLTVLARRHSPVWYEDVLAAVRKKPLAYINLLARESMFINAVIDLGTARSASAINRFSRTANLGLRKIYGMDLRRFALPCLEEATRVLEDCRRTIAA